MSTGWQHRDGWKREGNSEETGCDQWILVMLNVWGLEGCRPPSFNVMNVEGFAEVIGDIPISLIDLDTNTGTGYIGVSYRNHLIFYYVILYFIKFKIRLCTLKKHNIHTLSVGNVL